MKKRTLGIGLLLTGFAMTLGAFLIPSSKAKEAQGYSASSLPTTIDLNPTAENTVRTYYANANGKQGNELLKALKTILKNNQKYYSYDSGDTVWKMYEITDRDWVKSPASSISGFNSGTNTINGYSYNSTDPYVHALYINRDVNNQTKAWANHNQDQWGINREHVWPKAEGFNASGAGGARGDPMHLMAGNGYANNIHSNYYYGYVKTSSSYTDCGSTYSNQSGNLRGTSKTLNTGTVFEPQDSDKGDIARAIFYMVARYNYLSGSDSDGIDANNPNLALTQSISDWASSGYTSSTSNSGKMGVMTDLLAWHHADPVDDYEIKRNDLLYTNFTNNRNPFIDFPDWADYIWGSVNYNGSTYVSHNTTPTGSANPSSDTFHAFSGGSSDPVAVTGVELKESTTIEVGGGEVLVPTFSPTNATNKGVSWTSSNTNVVTVSSSGRIEGVAEGNATITVTTTDGSFTDSCSVTVIPSSALPTVNDSVDAKSGALPGWTASGTGTKYADGAVKFDSTGDSVINTSLFSGTVSSGMQELKVTINGKLNGSGDTSLNTYKVEAVDSNGQVLASEIKTDAFTGSYTDVEFTLDSNLTGCTGIKITYSNRSNRNLGVLRVSWVAAYSTEQEVTLSSIAVKTAPTKLTYTAGDGFDPNGLVITATYSDASTEDISFADHEDAFSFDPADNLQTSDVSVTISYGGKTCTQAISVGAAKTLSSITLNTDNVTKSFYVDDAFEHDNLVVTAHFGDSSTDVVSSSSTVTDPDMTTAGDKTITVSYTYGGTTKTATYTITVLESGGSQTGDYTWDLTDSTYSASSTEQVTWSSSCASMVVDKESSTTNANNYLPPSQTSTRFYKNSKLTITPSTNYEITSVEFTAKSTDYGTALRNSSWTNATASGSGTSVVITPTDGTSAFYATIGANCGFSSVVLNYSYTPTASLLSISLDTNNVQTTFSVGDTFNYTGLVVTASYTDGSSKVVTPTNVSTPSTATTGNKSVTVTYTENEVSKTANYSITVNSQPSISWTAPTINVYSGSTLSGTDVNAWAVTYNDGTGHQTVLTYSQLTVKLGGTTISIPHTWVATDDGKTLTATYNSLTTTASNAVQITQSVNTITKHTEPVADFQVANSISLGDTVYLAAASETYTVELNGISTTSTKYGIAAAYTTEPAKLDGLTVCEGATTGTFALKDKDNMYLYWSSGNSLNHTTTLDSNSSWNVTFNDGNASIVNASDSTRSIRYNSNSGQERFACYLNGGQHNVQLWKDVTIPGGDTVISNSLDHIAAQRVAVKFAKAFNAAMDTTSGCTTNLSSAWSTCSSAYDTFLSEAAALGSAEEAYAKDLIKYATVQYSDDSGEACIERMLKTYEICVQKHGQSDFMKDLVKLGKAPTSVTTLTLNNATNITIIVVASVIMIAAIGGYFYIRRLKQK